jgi:uncharacterized protein
MLKEQIKKESSDSLKSGNQLKRSVLSMLLNAIQNKELDKRAKLSKATADVTKLETQSQLNDEEVLEALASEIKKRKESVEQFEAANRKELADKERAEIEILSVYLPAQLGEDEIKAEVKKIISELGASGPKDMGRVIGAVMAKLKGRADGGTVSRTVKELLIV